MNVTLIGMPGAGKSYIGRKLAERLEYTCLEIDAILEKKYRLPLQKVLEKLGEKEFLRLEAQIVIEQTRGRNELVISPGGSMVYRANAMRYLKKISKIIYLKVPQIVLEKRIGVVLRGIIGAKDMSFSEIYAERGPLYEKYADYTIDGNRNLEKVVSDIIALLPSNSLPD